MQLGGDDLERRFSESTLQIKSKPQIKAEMVGITGRATDKVVASRAAARLLTMMAANAA